MARPLEVLADLQLTVDGEDIAIRGNGDRVVIDLPSLRAGRRLLSAGPLALGGHQRRTEQLHDGLSQVGVGVEVRLRGEPVAQMGAGAQPGALARLLNLGAVEVHPTRPLRAAAQRRPLLAGLVVGGVLLLLAWLLLRDSGT